MDQQIDLETVEVTKDSCRQEEFQELRKESDEVDATRISGELYFRSRQNDGHLQLLDLQA